MHGWILQYVLKLGPNRHKSRFGKVSIHSRFGLRFDNLDKLLWELCPSISVPFLDLTNVSIYCSYLELKYMPLIERIRCVSGRLECNSSMSVFLSLLPLLSVLSLKYWMSTITACLQIALPGVMILDWYFCCDHLINSFSRSFPIYVISCPRGRVAEHYNSLFFLSGIYFRLWGKFCGDS